MDILKQHYKNKNKNDIDINETYNLKNIPDIYDLKNFNTAQSYSIKFVYSQKSLQNTNELFKYILVNDTLIDKKYYITKITKYYRFNIRDFLDKINLNFNFNATYKMYIKTNSKDNIIIKTTYEYNKVYNMIYLKNIYINFFELCFYKSEELNKLNLDDNDVYINIYLTEDKNNVELRNKIFIFLCEYEYSEDKFINSINDAAYHYMYKVNMRNHNLSITDKCIKTFSLQLYNDSNILTNILIKLDLYCLDNENLYFYISKLINVETNEVINLLPDIICKKCKLIPSNFAINNILKKDMICKHIIVIIINNIKKLLNRNSLNLQIMYDDLNKLIKKIKVNKISNYTTDNHNKEIIGVYFIKSFYKDY